MDFLVFQLQAVLSSWGEAAVGEYRGSDAYPGESALIGLLAAGLGIRREDETAHSALQRSYAFAVGVQSSGHLLRDFHTTQVPGRAAFKGRPHTTRRQELGLPKSDFNTILSTRDYRQGAAYLIVVRASENSVHSLEFLREALLRPRFVLSLGRKCCPPGAPLHPVVLTAPTAVSALQAYAMNLVDLQTSRGEPAPNVEPSLSRVAWGQGMAEVIGLKADITVQRKDRLIRRQSWQFGDRVEHVSLCQANAEEH